MNKFLNIVLRFIIVLIISTVGITFLPNGKQKLEYLAFRYLGINLSFLTKTEEIQPEVIKVEEATENILSNKNTEEELPVEKTEEVQGLAVDKNSGSNLDRNRYAVNKTIGENYLDAVLSAGKLERWNPRSFPLKVYINSNSNIPPEYVTEIKNAFSTWQSASNDFISFIYVTKPNDADFYCNFPTTLINRNCSENGLGTAAYQYFEYDNSGNIKLSRIDFSAYQCDNKTLFPKNLFYSITLHEIGHGLGLRGHSTNSKDVMYPVALTADRINISKADLNTLRAIYSIIPDVTNLQFNETDKTKLVTTDKIWGKGAERADFTISQIRKNIALTPNQPSLYVELAAVLKDKKDYNGAIDAYKQALKYVDNKDSANSILFDAAQLYIKIGQTLSAQKCLDKISSRISGADDELAAMYMNLAVLHGQKKEYNQAQLLLDKSLMYASDEALKQMIYKNFLWIAYQQKDKILYNKYVGLVKK